MCAHGAYELTDTLVSAFCLEGVILCQDRVDPEDREDLGAAWAAPAASVALATVAWAAPAPAVCVDSARRRHRHTDAAVWDAAVCRAVLCPS